jgi:hypothetical protein
MKCPGQDRRYWKGGAVYEMPCPECGYTVEIFKDENAGRCRRCGHRFLNPGADFGCAQWCSLSNECLGIAPERGSEGDSGECALAARLIQWVEQEFRSDPSFIVHALRVYQYAKELVRKEGGDPRVVLSAALLFATGEHTSGPAEIAPEQSSCLPEAQAKVKEALQHLRLDEETAKRVCHDSQTLAKLAAEHFVGARGEWEKIIQSSLRTETAKNKARGLFRT